MPLDAPGVRANRAAGHSGGLALTMQSRGKRDRLGRLQSASRGLALAEKADPPFGDLSEAQDVFGGTPKTAVKTTALPNFKRIVTANESTFPVSAVAPF